MAVCQLSLWVSCWLPTFLGCSLIGFEARSALSLLFDAASYSPSTSLGWVQIIAASVGALGLAVAVALFVGRLRLAVDFAGSACILHWITIMALRGFPSSLAWWLVQLVCIISSCSLAELLCMRREMQEIALT